MLPPADLAPLRALVEAAQVHRHVRRPDGSPDNPVVPVMCDLCAALPAAREELGRVEKRHATPSPTNSAHDHGNCELCDWQEARLATMEAALAGTAEWQRVHGAAAQAARDVAYWRKRAEDAEARAVREGRDE